MPQNLTAALLVDQIVDYACATNENGEYCILAEMDNFNDVCALLQKQSL